MRMTFAVVARSHSFCVHILKTAVHIFYIYVQVSRQKEGKIMNPI